MEIRQVCLSRTVSLASHFAVHMLDFIEIVVQIFGLRNEQSARFTPRSGVADITAPGAPVTAENSSKESVYRLTMMMSDKGNKRWSEEKVEKYISWQHWDSSSVQEQLHSSAKIKLADSAS